MSVPAVETITSPTSPFFVTGGTMPADTPSYIERQADTDLFNCLKRGDLCYLLNARQMGKSSLSVRTRQALENAGIKTAFLDLQKFGSSANAEQWYLGLLAEVGRSVGLRKEVLAHWRDHAAFPPLTRLFSALRNVILEQLPGNLVIFLDEIDVVRDLPFKTDEFFGAIRESHNARTADPVLSRLTFCIIGTVAPSDLIRDVRLSPFNIGTRIKLADFTYAEAAPLATPLPGGNKTLERALWWTGGHPYLTQRLCAELMQSAQADVDGMVARLFFSKSDADVDESIKNVRNGVLRMGDEGAGFDRTDLLTRYGQILSGKRVIDDDTDGVCTSLRLLGLVTATNGVLHVRNRIYARIFDIGWVNANLPDAELRRQRAAVLKARWQIGSITAAVLLVMGCLTLWAINNANRAEINADSANRLAYIASANQAQRAMADNRYGTADAFLSDMHALLVKDRYLKAGYELPYLEEQMHLEIQQYKGHTNFVRAVAFSPDGKQILTGSEDGTARLWETTTGRSPVTFRGHSGPVTSVAFSGDGKSVLTGSDDSTVRLWNASTGETISVFSGLVTLPVTASTPINYRRTGQKIVIRDARVNSVAFSPDGKQILIGSQDNAARLCDLKTRKLLRVFNGHAGPVNSAVFSPDGKRILTGSDDSSVRVWDSLTGRTILLLNGHRQSVLSVTFSPDQRQILTGGQDKTAQLWDAQSGRRLSTFSHAGTVGSVAFSPDGRRIVTGVYDNTAHVWDVKTGQEVLVFRGHSGSVSSVAFSPDGGQVLTGSYDNTPRLWDAAIGREVTLFKGHKADINSVGFSAEGKYMVTGSDDGTARLWNVMTGQTLSVLKGNPGDAFPTAISPNGKQIATAGSDNIVHLRDAMTGQEIVQFKGHTDQIRAIVFSQDGELLLTGSNDRTARLWETKTGKEIEQLLHTSLVTSIAFSPNGKQIATGSWTNDTYLWDRATGRQIATLKHPGAIRAVAFSPSGKQVVTAGEDTTARIWDTSTGQSIAILRGHASGISSVAFSPDGNQIVTGSWDKTARLWDVVTVRELLTFPHPAAVSSVAFSPDGSQILTGCADGTARIWRRMTDRQAQEVERYEESARTLHSRSTR